MEVKTVYLERELIRAEFLTSHLVSDHPPQFGGEGKGPSPGELLLAGLTAAGVFDTRTAAVREGANLGTIVVRSVMQVDREGFEGPLGPLAIVARVARRLELTGSLTGQDAARLTQGSSFVQMLENGITIDEGVNFTGEAEGLIASDWINETLQESGAAVVALKPGKRQVSALGDWRVHATELAPGLAIVHLSGAPILVSNDGRMGCSTPHELVLASLATCTTIYVARNARFHSIPIEGVTVKVTAEPLAEGQPMLRVAKQTTVGGSLSPDEAAKCSFFAEFCAIGESLKRGISVQSEVIVVDGHEVAPVSRGAADALDLLMSSDPACGDGSCCIA